MKRISAFILFLSILSASFVGCTPVAFNIPSETEIIYEDMEVYKVMTAGMTENSTLDEMLSAFSDMCQVPIDVSLDMYLLEVHQSTLDGKPSLYCTIVRQMEIPGHIDFIEIGFTVEYWLDDDLTGFDETKFFENDWEGFIEYIKTSEFYGILLTKDIVQRNVGIDSW